MASRKKTDVRQVAQGSYLRGWIGELRDFCRTCQSAEAGQEQDLANALSRLANDVPERVALPFEFTVPDYRKYGDTNGYITAYCLGRIRNRMGYMMSRGINGNCLATVSFVTDCVEPASLKELTFSARNEAFAVLGVIASVFIHYAGGETDLLVI